MRISMEFERHDSLCAAKLIMLTVRAEHYGGARACHRASYHFVMRALRAKCEWHYGISTHCCDMLYIIYEVWSRCAKIRPLSPSHIRGGLLKVCCAEIESKERCDVKWSPTMSNRLNQCRCERDRVDILACMGEFMTLQTFQFDSYVKFYLSKLKLC